MGMLSWLKRWTAPAISDKWHWMPASPYYYTDSGEAVTPERALQLAAVFACVRVVTETISTLPMHLYERNTTGGRRTKIVYDHPVATLLRRPNTWMTRSQYGDVRQASQELHGNAYTEIVYAGNRPIALLPLSPARITQEWGGSGIIYKMRGIDGQMRIIPQERMLHDKPMTQDGFTGQTPIMAAAETIGASLAASRYGARVLRSGGLRRMALKTSQAFQANDNDRKKLELLRDTWATTYGDNGDGTLANQHRVAVLHSGLEPVNIGIDPRDAQMIELLGWGVVDICRAFRVPPHKIMDLTRATFSNIEHQAIEFVQDAILPRCVRNEETINATLLANENERYFVKYNLDGLLRGDLKTRMEAHAVAIQNGIKSRNECRDDEDLNPYEGGDTMLVPLNMIEVGAPEQGASDDGSAATKDAPILIETRARGDMRAKLRAQWLPVIEEAYTRLAKREKKDILSAAKKAAAGRDRAELIAWLKEWEARYAPSAQRVLGPPLSSFEAAIAEAAAEEIGVDVGEGMRAWLLEWYRGYGKRHAGRVVRELESMLVDVGVEAGADEWLDQLEKRMDVWEGRAANDAVMRVTQSDGAVARELWRRSGVKRIRWNATGENCPFCSQLDGKVVGIESAFVPQGEAVEAEGKQPIWAGADVLHPPLHSGCDCRIEVER